MIQSGVLIASLSFIFAYTSGFAKTSSNAVKIHSSIVSYTKSLQNHIKDAYVFLNIIGNEEEKAFVKTSITGELISQFNASIITDSPNSEDATVLTVQLLEIGTRYSNYDESSDSLKREIVFTCNTTISKGKDSQKNIIVLPQFKQSDIDIISKSEIEEIQLPGFTFCKGTIPQSKETFLSDIVQPIVYISTAILSTYLLFSVRSK
jgi:hypothetical protein